MPKDRLQKIISASGLLSRRKAELAILEGRVRVNGQVVQVLGSTADPDQDQIELDGRVVPLHTEPLTWVFYKPRGVLTTKSDDRGRRTVMNYFQDRMTLKPVGRLDFESEGLLLMSEDGQLHLHLTHPRYGFQKIYEVEIRAIGSFGKLHPNSIQDLLSGVDLEDGPGRFDSIERIGEREAAESYRVTVGEGRNRFIRRMFSAVGFEVLRLKRIQMGPISLGDLKPGERRMLTENEIEKISQHLSQTNGGKSLNLGKS